MTRHACLVLALSLSACARPAPPPIRVAAASDLTAAFTELAGGFREATGEEVSLTFGSTGLLARQLEEGAPFDLFAAASIAFADRVVAAGGCDGDTRALYGRGRLVVWVPSGTPPPLGALEGAGRVAIASPEHAPYGVAAREALIASGVWDAVRPRLVYGENVQQALQMAASGNADVALVALALVLSRPGGAHLLVDEHLHAPLDQALVVCRHGARFEGGKAFAAHVASPAGRAVMRRHGFTLPGEAVAAP